MTKQITPTQFHDADGVEDWRVVGDGVCAYFRTGSFAAGARLGYADRADSPEDLVDPHRRGPSLWFQRMDAPRPQRNRIHIDVWVPHDRAEARIAAALAAGGRMVNDGGAPSGWVLADAEGNE